MNFAEYQEAARRTIGPEIKGVQIEMLNNAALGLTGEAGEVADHVKKVKYHHQPVANRRISIFKELGDILWYLSLAADAIGYTMEEIAEGNIDKLLERHPGPGVDFSYHDKQP